MTVTELIEKLKLVPPDNEVQIAFTVRVWGESYSGDVTDVSLGPDETVVLS